MMPATLEICARLRDGHPCLGAIYRPLPDSPYCFRCGGTESGEIYVRQVDVHGLVEELGKETAA